MTKIKILSEHGVHARPASLIVNALLKHDCEVNFIKDGNKYNAKSIMNIMGMGLKNGDEIELEIIGEYAETVEKELLDIFNELNG
ncbi:HPr family phosphocarrier protein [Clostridiaceae bacterium HSG29]|nr:HPr family phosphocarrier protein [Clostridiaceae bacterium HSG29]